MSDMKEVAVSKEPPPTLQPWRSSIDSFCLQHVPLFSFPFLSEYICSLIFLCLFHVFGQMNSSEFGVVGISCWWLPCAGFICCMLTRPRHPKADIQRERNVLLCVCLRLYTLFLWPTGGKLMPLSGPDILPPHFSLLPCRPVSPPLFSPFLCFLSISLSVSVFPAQIDTLVSSSCWDDVAE